MIPTVDMVVRGLKTMGYTEVGGSDFFRIMENALGQQIKIYYNNYKKPTHIVIRESVEAYEDGV